MDHLTDDELWERLQASEAAFHSARMALLKESRDVSALGTAALLDPSHRGTALRLLEILPAAESQKPLVQLVSLAAVGHSDIDLCRRVLLRMDHDWLVQHIDAPAALILEQGGGEEYLRLAELYRTLDATLLRVHLERCASHSDSEVREISADFRSLQRR